MSLLLTGCSGFVGRFVLRELLDRYTAGPIQVLLRSKKGQSAQERWDSSICQDSLFFYKSAALARVQVVDGDLENLEGISWPAGAPSIIVHCAANVRTIDTYANLYRDNVLGVQHLCDAAVAWGVKRMALVSTCYVHPRNTVGKPHLLAENLPKELFTTDYTYTKYLGEHVAATYADRLQISILRLSCVGAPVGWLDAHPTPAAMAHLGIVSLILRGRLRYARIPSTAQLSTIPVDIVSSQIVGDVLASPPPMGSAEGPRILQICADPQDPIWNLSLPRLYITLQRLAPNLKIEMIDCAETEFRGHLEKYIGLRRYTPWGYKDIRFHEEINTFISKFADGQRFETSVPASAFPHITAEAAYEQTCLYVARGNHQHLLEKGVTKPKLNTFWGAMNEHHITMDVTFKDPVHAPEERFFSIYAAYRPMFTNPGESKMAYVATARPVVEWVDASAAAVQFGTAPLEVGGVRVGLVGDINGGVTQMKLNFHHGVGDGAALLTIAPRGLDPSKEVPLQTLPAPTAKSKPLTWSQEGLCFLYTLAFLIKLLFKDATARTSVGKQTFATETTRVQKRSGFTFTTSLLEQAFPALRSATHKETVTYCIPAMTEGPQQRGLDLPHNAFVPILIPWGAGENTMAKLCLRSKAVKLLFWILAQVITALDANGFRDYVMARVDCVVSSVLASDVAIPSMKSAYFHAPTPTPIPFTLSALTVAAETYVTVASRREDVPAGKLMKEILATK